MRILRFTLRRRVMGSVLVGCLPLAWACFDTETDLFDNDPGPPADVDGIWSYSVVAQNAVASCTASGITLTFDQDDTEFTGAASGGALVCEVLDESFTDSIGVRPLVNGNVSGRIVVFGIGDDNWIHVGQVSEDSDVIAGQTEIVRQFPEISTQTMLGSFEARRQLQQAAAPSAR